MNKIYKVIWSKVKHQYVVVSELAHSCTKSTSSRVGRSAAAVLAALVLTTGVCAVPVQAADPTLEELYYEQINRAIQNGETSSPLVTLAEVPATTSAATEDGEPAAEEETQPGEDGSVTGTASQYTVTNKDGFYANNTKGTHNTLSKDGLWVGGKDDNTGFHVDNDGNVRTTGSVTVKSEQGDVIIQNGGVQAGNVKINTDGKNTITGLTNTTWDGTTETPDRAATEGQLGQVQGDLNELNKAAVKYDSDGQGGYTNNVTIGGQVTANSFQNTDGSFSVDANGNVDAETVKSEGMSVVDEDGNTTFQVLANGDVTAHDVTATTVTGGTVIGETIRNTNNSFSVDANGNVDAETVKSEGMSVVDEDGNTTFQVLANGDVTAHDVTATTVTGGTVIGETIRNTNNSFSVDANGNVDAETVKSEGMSVVDEDGNTTFQVLSNGDVTAHAVTATTVTGGTIQNADGSFSVDANGNVDAETVKSEGMSVVDEDGNTTFQVLANGDVTAHDVIANSYSNVNGTFVADENGKVTAEKGDIGDVWLSEGNISNVKNIKAESGNIGDVKLADGKVTAEKGDIGDVWLSEGNISNVKNIKAESGNIGDVKLADGKVTAEKGDIGDVWLSEGNISNVKKITAESGNIGDVKLADGKVTADKGDIGDVWLSEGNISNVKNIKAESGNIGDVKLADGKVTAEKGDIGDVWLSEGNISNVKNIKAESGNIGDVKLADGKITAEKGDIGDVWLSEGNISNVKKITAESGNIGDVKLADGKVTAQKADIGGVFIKNESIQAGNIKINENGSNEITGLSNTRWNDGTPVDEDRAATEGQLSTVQGYVDDLEAKTQHITHKENADGTHYTTVEEANFYSDGRMDAANGKFRVNEKGGVNVNDGAFQIYSSGGVQAAHGKFRVKGKTGEVTVDESLSVGKHDDGTYAFTVDKAGNAEVDGTMVIQGQTIINADADIKGSLEAAGNKFKVDGVTGEVTAPKGNIGGVILETTAEDGKSKVSADKADIGGVWIKEGSITTEEGTITAGDVVINSAGSEKINVGNGNFIVYEDGAVRAADDNFIVYKDGSVEAQGTVQAADATFAKDSRELVTAGQLYKAGIVPGEASGVNSMAIGTGAQALSTQAVAVGYNAAASGSYSVALGMQSGAHGTDSVALGRLASATADDSVALGANSVADRPNTVSVGREGNERQITNVADGIKATDAVNKGQLDTLAKGAVMYDVDEAGNITDNVTIGGKMEASEFANSNNTFMVTEDGAIWASGGGNIDGVGFQDGVVTAPEGISAGYDAFKVDAQGNVSTDGTIIAQGNSMIGGVTLEDGNVLTNEVWAGNNNFHVNETGSVTAPSVTGLENTEWNADEVVADRAATEGQLAAVNTQVSNNSEILAEYEDAGITAGSVDGEAEGAIAIGEGAAAINGNSIPNGAIAIGREATVSMNGAVAIGDGANAVGQNSVALGTGASTTNGGWNSVAIGWGSQATDSYVVSVGSDEYKRRIVNVAAGENDNDAVNVGQLNSSLKSRVEYDYTTEADGTKTYKDTIGGVTLKEGEVTANTFKNSDSTFQVTEDGTIVARGGGLIDGVGFEDGKVTATDFVLSTGTQSPVNMSDMWKVMTGGTFEYGTQTYGGAYFTKTGNTSYINYGGTSNINLNNLGQVMGAVENVGVDTVTSAINDLGQGKNASGASMNEKASTENTTETAVGPAANEILAAPAANEALAAPAMARPMAISTVTNSALSAPQEAKEVTRDPVYGTGSDGAAIIDTNLTVTGDTHLKGDLEVDGEATFNDNVSIKGDLNMNNNKITGVADGTDAHDAVNFGQLDKVQQQVDANTQNISTLGGAVNKLGNRIDEVGAGAAALAALHPLDFDPDNKWDFSAGFGNYRGESAVAFGAFYRPNEDTMFSVGGTVGNDDNMVNAGVSLKIGSGSSGVTTSRVAMAKEIKAMRDVVAKQDAQIQKLTAMVNALVGVQTEPDTTTMFPDVPENHWAYEAVAAMARSGLVKGYPDGEFKGDRTMTRYEFAQIIQNAIQVGAEVDSRLVEEFKPELEYFHIATVAKDKDGNPTIERVRAN